MHSTSELAIELTDVSVRYRVPKEPIRTLKEHFVRRVTRRQSEYRDFMALQNISYSIRAGEAIGVIGRNGAGKSTLLKVISRVLIPTTGRVRVVGKIAPLIELGMGFQGELTGRENVFINAAMLGFAPREIKNRLDRIIDFAELSDFIDSPIRTYSSGMVARLGFAVAIDVEPDILVIDEVLSVGDMAFQKKCMERLKQFRQNGVTVIYVTHAVRNLAGLCDKALLIDNSHLVCAGEIETVVTAYQQLLAVNPARVG
jgi:lipopolysaccharide transport system ATP-binding protein